VNKKSKKRHLNSLQPGSELHWYEFWGILGQGGFSITYLADNKNLAHEVAIKEYIPIDLAARAGDGSVESISQAHHDRYLWGLERFIEEARTLVYSIFEIALHEPARYIRPLALNELPGQGQSSQPYLFPFVVEYELSIEESPDVEARVSMTGQSLVSPKHITSKRIKELFYHYTIGDSFFCAIGFRPFRYCDEPVVVLERNH
jgi:hypothetical protein